MGQDLPAKESAIKKLQNHFDRASVLYFVGLIFAMGLFTGTSNVKNDKQDEAIIKHDIRITKVENDRAESLVEPARNDEQIKSIKQKDNEQDGAIILISKDIKDTKDLTIETQKMVIELWEDKTGKRYHAPTNR